MNCLYRPLLRCYRLIIIGTLLGLFSALVWAESEITERIQWSGTPIKLVLAVGEERMIRFPAPVKIGVPASLQSLLRTQSVDGTLYLLARHTFAPTRVMVREIASGRIYLIDLEARTNPGPTPPVEVFVPAAESTGPDVSTSDDQENNQPSGIGYVGLTRFAARQLYAPARLLQNPPGINRVPVRREPITLVRGGAVYAMPLIAWRAGAFYVTAVKLVNQDKEPVPLDPHLLRGKWLAATFQHNRLLGAGSAADTTAVYLISARPFAASLR